jgi:hypothetical protein
MSDKVIGRGALGLILLRYGNHFPYTSLLIQSLKATHYITLERNLDDLKVRLVIFPVHTSLGRVFLKKYGRIYPFDSGGK